VALRPRLSPGVLLSRVLFVTARVSRRTGYVKSVDLEA
jgi:hypothetical protein